jgi:hypothetical protein
MRKKIQFFDSICFRGEIDLLLFRLTELDPYVDRFIISEITSNTEESVFLTNINLFEKWSDKISYILSNDETYLLDIKNEFVKLTPYFEDVLMISNTNEIPNLKYKDVFTDKLVFNYFIIEHKNLIWNIDYMGSELSRGTMVVNLSLIIQVKNLFDRIFKDKVTDNLIRSFVLENGWKVSNFRYDPNYDFYIEEKLFPTDVNPVTTYQLIKHNNQIELPTNVDLLPYVKIGRDEVRKHLFLVESDVEYMDGYDTITIIKFSSNLQETLCEKVSDITTKSVLYLPDVVLYGDSDLETFQDEYMLNETKRMFSVVFPQEQDVIDVIFKNKKPLGLGGVLY